MDFHFIRVKYVLNKVLIMEKLTEECFVARISLLLSWKYYYRRIPLGDCNNYDHNC